MDKALLQQTLSEILQEMGFLVEGKPAFVSSADFGKTATLINQLKKSQEGLVPQQKLQELIANLGFEQAEDGKYTFKGAGTSPAAPPKPEDDVLKQMKADMAKMQKDMADKDRIIAEKDAARETAEVHSQIQALLAKHGAINPARDYVHLTNLVTKAADGKLTGKSKDKYGQEQDLELDTFVEQWLSGQPELKKGTAAPGSGAAPGGSAPPAPGKMDFSKMSVADYQKQRDTIMGGGS